MIQTIDGESVRQEYVELSVYMIKNEIDMINIEYSGSGDSGDASANAVRRCKKEGEKPEWEKVELSNEMEKYAVDIALQIVNPDFNNDGSYGNAYIEIVDGKMKFSAQHNVVITDTEEHSYSQDLLDTEML